MQTPQGYALQNGIVVPVDWFKIIFNPSFPYRLLHMSVAAFLVTAFFVGASAAYHLLRKNDTPAVRKMLSMSLWMALIVSPIQAMIGDAHGLNTLEHQPAKIAAIEGHWENRPGEATPLILFGMPDMQEERTKYAVEIPYLGSLILTHSLDKQVPALKSFPKEDRPDSRVVFWSFRVMVGLGMLMILLGAVSLWMRRGQRLYTSRPFLWFVLLMGPSGLIALVAGWITTEMGRQPWVIYGLLRTRDAVSLHSTLQMSISLIVFLLVYCAVFGVGYSYLANLIKKGPQTGEGHPPADGGPGTSHTPARPLSAVKEKLQSSQEEK
ncbi:MAG TPA: cytochrome ubiquinol oxidase subunit I, partial [Erwinia persicina]|nr:cytochrome ubiquinol oxidase subunit I [Erwinia persicina]